MEKWILKTSDGQEYNFRCTWEYDDPSVDGVYNLLKGTKGHHGMPTTFLTDVMPNIAGAELRQVLRGVRTMYMPTRIRGNTAADLDKNKERLRASIVPETECQLWITNNNGETRVLYMRYIKGFDESVDDEKRSPTNITIPLYFEADDPYFYDPAGSEITRTILADPFSAPFLTPTVVLENLTADAIEGTSILTVSNATNFSAGQTVEMIGGGYRQTCVIDSVDIIHTPQTITLKGELVHSCLVADRAYVQVIDNTEIFVTVDSETRVLNDGCEYVIFWMRGCPPCYTALDQLATMQVNNPNIKVTKVEIQDRDASSDGIGMDAAWNLYNEAYVFATNCGPSPAAAYEIIHTQFIGGVETEVGSIMPAVIALYREGMFIQAWCGVHTTGVDPIATNELEDACGPRINWRVGKKYLGNNIVINNTGDATAFPVWTINGPGSSVHLTNITTGDDFLLNHTLIAGEVVIIDSRETSHTCMSTSQANYQGTGYWAYQTCPTCKGAGVVPASCCGGYVVCPTCHGTGTIQVWIASASGSTDAAGMYNIRPQIDVNSRVFWGFAPGPNVIRIEVPGADLTNTSVNFNLVRRYEGT